MIPKMENPIASWLDAQSYVCVRHAAMQCVFYLLLIHSTEIQMPPGKRALYYNERNMQENGELTRYVCNLVCMY